MSRPYVSNQPYESLNFTTGGFNKGGEYEGCMFSACNFAGLDLSGVTFIDCQFDACDFSMAKLTNGVFQDVHFKGCKQLGLRFDECSKMILSFSFEACVLNLSVFCGLKLKGTRFSHCQLQEVDFGGSDLTNADFSGSDLNRAVFENTVLEGVDFRSASNFSIDPDLNKVRKARFSAQGLAGLLRKHQIVVDG